MLPSIRTLQFNIAITLVIARALKFGPERIYLVPNMTKDILTIFLAFISVAKLLFLQNSYVAQYPDTTITRQFYINFDRQVLALAK